MSTLHRLALGLGILVAATVAAPVLAAPGTRELAQASAPAPRTRAVGDAVLIEWGGSYWRGEVLASLSGGRAVVHYAGWGDEWDEVTPPARLRTEEPLGAVAVGDRVFVEWHGSYWPAVVTRLDAANYRIHYEGYGPEWDEAVSRARLLRCK